MDNIQLNKDNAGSIALTAAFATLVVAGTHFLMETVSNGISTVSNKISEARNAKESK